MNLTTDQYILHLHRLRKSSSAQRERLKELESMFRQQFNGKKDDQFFALKVEQAIKEFAIQVGTQGQDSTIDANLDLVDMVFKRVLAEELAK